MSAQAPRITEDEVRKVARLARLSPSDETLHKMRAQLDAILDYVASLDALDVRDVPPTFHAVPMSAMLRPDEIAPSLPREEALRNAPKSDAGGFAVPKVMEGEG